MKSDRTFRVAARLMFIGMTSLLVLSSLVQTSWLASVPQDPNATLPVKKPTPANSPAPKKGTTPSRKSAKPLRATKCTAQSPTQGTGRTHTANLGSGVTLELVEIPPGSFCMGSENGEADEKPVHWVKISNGFYMRLYEVTQAQWRAVMGHNPSHFKGDSLPVESVSWDPTCDRRFFNQRLKSTHDQTSTVISRRRRLHGG